MQGSYFHNIILWSVCAFLTKFNDNLAFAQVQNINLNPGEFQEISIHPGQSIVVTPTSASIPSGGYALVQAHAVRTNVTISFTSVPSPGQSVTGSSVGLVNNGTTSGSKIFVINGNNASVNVLMLMEVYDGNAPIPGGCNMELPIKTAPYLPTSFTQNILTVQYPLGSWPLNVKPATCDRAPLQYDIYIYFLPERDFSVRTAFDGLRLMSNVSSVEKYGTKVKFNGLPPSKIKFTNYVGTGRIVAVLLRTLTSSSAYVPTLSYGCLTNTEDSLSDCDVLGSTVSVKLLSAWLVFAGLFLISLGHRYYKCQLFLFGFLVSAVFFYVALMLIIDIGSAVAGTTATVVGAVGGAAWVIIWAKCGTPIGPVFLASFILGSLFASIIAYTPLVDLSVMKDDLTFWLAYFCLVLIVPLVIVSFDKLTSILVSCLVGAYVFTAPVDHYVGSNLKYIFLNVIRRATDREFTTAIIQPPYQMLDIILTVTWALLAIVGMLFQLWRERDRAPFPPTPGPWNWPSTMTNITNTRNDPRMLGDQVPIVHPVLVTVVPTERTPLLNH